MDCWFRGKKQQGAAITLVMHSYPQHFAAASRAMVIDFCSGIGLSHNAEEAQMISKNAST